MKVMQLVARIQVDSDGVSVCCRNLSIAMSNITDVEVHTFNVPGFVPPQLQVKTYNCNHFPKLLKIFNGIGVSSEMKKGLLEIADNFDIIHANCLWMQLIGYAYKATKNNKVKLVIQPHGTLSPWALRQSRLKKLFSAHFLFQNKALHRADMLIATSIQEYQDIRNYGLTQPVAVIPIGIGVPELPFNIKKEKNLVFLSRINPYKGIDILLKSWLQIQDRFPEWNLLIAGNNDNPYGDSLKAFAKENNCKRVQFVGELNGEAKFEFLSKASLFVLPSHSENFSLAVGEALACSTPVVTTTGTPWSGLVENECGLWIDLSADNLTEALTDMMSRSMEELVRLGQNGRRWVLQDFSWDGVARKMLESYEWLLKPENVKKPDFVYVD